MNTWNAKSIQIARDEIRAISYNQNPTGRTSGEHDFFEGLIVAMLNKKLTPAEAIMKARGDADSRQDGHGEGSIQDGY